MSKIRDKINQTPLKWQWIHLIKRIDKFTRRFNQGFEVFNILLWLEVDINALRKVESTNICRGP